MTRKSVQSVNSFSIHDSKLLGYEAHKGASAFVKASAS